MHNDKIGVDLRPGPKTHHSSHRRRCDVLIWFKYGSNLFISEPLYKCNGGRKLDNRHHLRFITLINIHIQPAGYFPKGNETARPFYDGIVYNWYK